MTRIERMFERPGATQTHSLAALRASVQAGPGADAVRLLTQVDAATLDAGDRVTLLQAWELALRWVTAQHSAAVVAVAGERAVDRDDFAREEVRVALLGCGGSPKADVELARLLAGPLLSVRDAMATGAVSHAHARVFDDETRHLDPATTRDVAREVLDRIVPSPANGDDLDDALSRCARVTPSQLRQRLRRAALRADPAAAELRARSAARERQVSRRAEPHGQASLFITGPALEVTTIWTALDLRATSQRAAGDDRSLDRRRFDALVDLCRLVPAQAAGSGSRTRVGLVPTVHLYADAPTWVGISNEPVELAGYGPIPAGIAREHFQTSTWRAVVTDTLTALPLAVSDATYVPSTHTRRQLHTRDRHCTFPGCTAAVWFCDADHTTPHALGGSTDTSNCLLLCRRHHRLKTHTAWQPGIEPDGRTRWTDPQGLRWIRDPVTYEMPPPVDARACSG